MGRQLTVTGEKHKREKTSGRRYYLYRMFHSTLRVIDESSTDIENVEILPEESHYLQKIKAACPYSLLRNFYHCPCLGTLIHLPFL